MVDITPEYEAQMRDICQRLNGTTPISPAVLRQYFDVITPAHVMLMLDAANIMVEAVEKIDDLVKRAGFNNLEDALLAIERIGKALHGRD